jgi:glycosyltransferase involved in cell wall biosynthesis
MTSEIKGLIRYDEPQMPLVTVLAVCFNHAKYVEQALDSAVGFNYPNLQLLISDDCSTDNSKEVIEKWLKEKGVDAYFKTNQQNKGLCATLNEALPLVKGKYLHPAPGDDYYHPEKIAEYVKILEDDTDCAMVCGNFRSINAQGDIIQERFFEEDFIFPDDPFKAILNGYSNKSLIVHSPTILYRFSDMQKHIGQYPEDILQEDFYALLNLTAKAKIKYHPKVYTYYRVLNDSLSNTLLTGAKRIIYLKDHLKVLNGLEPKLNSYQKELVRNDKIKRWLKLSSTLNKQINQTNRVAYLKEILITVKNLATLLDEKSNKTQRQKFAYLLIRLAKNGFNVPHEVKPYLRFLPFKSQVKNIFLVVRIIL